MTTAPVPSPSPDPAPFGPDLPARLRPWALEIVLGALVFGFGITSSYVLYSSPLWGWPLVGLLTTAVVCFRRRPGAALLCLTMVVLVQLWWGVPPFTAQVAVALVPFGCAAYGSRKVLWVSGLVLPVLGLTTILVAIVIGYGTGNLNAVMREVTTRPLAELLVPMFNDLWFVTVGIGALYVLPWFAGLGVRSVLRSRADRAAAEEQRDLALRERAYAQQVADLKAGQAQLARDVHDVVGHSLAVILAQAESAQFIPDDDPAQMKQVLTNVADSARRSLQDVRAVLTSTRGAKIVETPTAGIDALVDGVRMAGNDVRPGVLGTPTPLSPELDQVAYRVLQEMLTNALKHGRRSGPVWVEQAWAQPGATAYLRLSVRNPVDAAMTRPLPVGGGPDPAGMDPSGLDPSGLDPSGLDPSGLGLGLDSMRHRLESVGGELHVDRQEAAQGMMFVATAWVPLRAPEVA